MSEDRDIPEMHVILEDLDNLAVKLDKIQPIDAPRLRDEITNSLIPMIKDGFASLAIDLEEISPPVQVSVGDAHDIGEMLDALAAVQPGNTELLERIKSAKEALELVDDAEGEEEEA